MNESKARNIGAEYAIKSILIGILLFYLIPAIIFLIGDFRFKSLFWVIDLDFYNWLFIFNWVFFFFVFAVIYGRSAGFEILIQKKDYEKTGMKYGILTLITASFFGCFLGFFWEGFDNIGTGDDPFNDYFFKPLFWLSLFGIIPSILVGRWLGKKIKLSTKNTNE